jgi:ribosomal-protein-alanine N-acetyltransferase
MQSESGQSMHGEQQPAGYVFAPLRPQDARVIATWHYPGDYAIYDQPLVDLLQAAALRGLWSLMGLQTFSVFADAAQRDLIGLFTFTRQGRTVIIGLQLRPDLTGHGCGLAFLRAGMRFAIDRYHPTALLLHVAAFNQRAITVYQRAGFQTLRTVQRPTRRGQMPHLEMRYPVAAERQ